MIMFKLLTGLHSEEAVRCVRTNVIWRRSLVCVLMLHWCCICIAVMLQLVLVCDAVVEPRINVLVHTEKESCLFLRNCIYFSMILYKASNVKKN